jgi:hypothetical protein
MSLFYITLEVYTRLGTGSAQDELSGINECDAFVLGFRLGGRFMLEVMENMAIPFIDE